MKKTGFVIALVGVLVFCSPWTTQAQQGGGLAKLMNEKLNNSKKLLEGIALADYNRIASSAEELIQISRKTEWFIFKTPKFELYTNEFRRAAENIISKSKEKSIDGVTLAYFELTMSCVHCHQYVREVREARLPSPGSDLVAFQAKE